MGDDAMAKLLIVDDEVDIREYAKRFFTKRKIEVITASDGPEALEIIEREKPDIVLLDISMPKMNGLEVLKRLRANRNDVDVVMVTSSNDEESVNEANSWGIRGYIHKPLILEELEKKVMSELKSKGLVP